MKSWPMEDAEARFSELLNACLVEGPQMVTRHGVEVAVLVSKDEWQRLTRAARPGLKELLLGDEARGEVPVPKRGGLRRRVAL